MKSLSIKQLVVLFAVMFGGMNLAQSLIMLSQANARPDQSWLSELQPAINTHLQNSQQMARAYANGNTEEGKRLQTAVETSHAAVTAALKHTRAQDGDTSITVYVIIFALGYASLLVYLLYIVFRFVINPAAYLQAQLNKIAKGDFSAHIEIRRQDELGDIAAAVQSIVNELGSNLRRITCAGMQVSAYAHALLYLIDDNEQSLQSQQNETQRIVDTISHLGETAATVEARSVKASSSSGDVRVQARAGEAIIKTSVDNTLKLTGELDKANHVIHELANSAGEINQVIAVIESIAEQTNLLALNAAIEAARAGDHGRGFAVVADEVRTLAQKTQKSTLEINQMVTSLQQLAAEAVAIISVNQNQAKENASISHEANASMHSIFEAIAKIDELNKLISTAASEQKNATTEVEVNVQTIAELSQRFRSTSERTQRFSEKLSQEARNFSRLSANFNM